MRANSVQPLSNDQKPMRPDEHNRIQEAGGTVLGGRVMGRLAVSRAFGQKKMKALVPAEPEVLACPLRDDDEFVLVACDGLWDVLSDAEAAMLIRSQIEGGADLKAAARALTAEALNRGSLDNVTALIIALRPTAGAGAAAVQEHVRMQPAEQAQPPRRTSLSQHFMGQDASSRTSVLPAPLSLFLPRSSSLSRFPSRPAVFLYMCVYVCVLAEPWVVSIGWAMAHEQAVAGLCAAMRLGWRRRHISPCCTSSSWQTLH